MKTEFIEYINPHSYLGAKHVKRTVVDLTTVKTIRMFRTHHVDHPLVELYRDRQTSVVVEQEDLEEFLREIIRQVYHELGVEWGDWVLVENELRETTAICDDLVEMMSSVHRYSMDEEENSQLLSTAENREERARRLLQTIADLINDFLGE